MFIKLGSVQKLWKEIEQNINGIRSVYGGREAEQIIEQTNTERKAHTPIHKKWANVEEQKKIIKPKNKFRIKLENF